MLSSNKTIVRERMKNNKNNKIKANKILQDHKDKARLNKSLQGLVFKVIKLSKINLSSLQYSYNLYPIKIIFN